MSGRTSANPNRFGANSAGLCRLVDEVLQLSDEQWLSVGEASRQMISLRAADVTDRQNRADLSERSAVEKLLDETFQSLRVRLREVGGRPLSMRARGVCGRAPTRWPSPTSSVPRSSTSRWPPSSRWASTVGRCRGWAGWGSDGVLGLLLDRACRTCEHRSIRVSTSLLVQTPRRGSRD